MQKRICMTVSMLMTIAMTRHDTTRHDTTRHDTTRHDTTRHDTTRHERKVRNATASGLILLEPNAAAVPEGAFWRAQRARKTEDYLTGLPMEARTMSEALSTLTSEMQPASCEGRIILQGTPTLDSCHFFSLRT